MQERLEQQATLPGAVFTALCWWKESALLPVQERLEQQAQLEREAAAHKQRLQVDALEHRLQLVQASEQEAAAAAARQAAELRRQQQQRLEAVEVGT